MRVPQAAGSVHSVSTSSREFLRLPRSDFHRAKAVLLCVLFSSDLGVFEAPLSNFHGTQAFQLRAPLLLNQEVFEAPQLSFHGAQASWLLAPRLHQTKQFLGYPARRRRRVGLFGLAHRFPRTKRIFRLARLNFHSAQAFGSCALFRFSPEF